MHHRRHHEVQRESAQRETIAVLHFHILRAAFTIEASHHLERLLVADDLHLRVVLANEGDGTAVVGLHVVDNEVVDGPFADDLTNILQILREEVHLHRIH